MKKGLIIGGSILTGLVTLFFVVAGLLPPEFRVTRSMVIQAPPARIFDLVDNLRQLVEWSPWRAADPTMEFEFSDPPAGLGAWYRWSSEDSGRGIMTIVKSERPREILTELEFAGGKMAAQGGFLFEPVSGGTRVTWSIEGDDGGHVAHRYFFVFMDSMVGHMCVDGLSRLKVLAESNRELEGGVPEETDRAEEG
jgi:uncharacterized protein YndB with AHSA1/START domain